MPPRTETPWPPAGELLCRHFHSGPAYKNWRPHGTGDWLLIYTDTGAGLLSTSLGHYETRPGDAVLYAPGAFQEYCTAPGCDIWGHIWVHFLPRPGWTHLLQWPASKEGLRLFQAHQGDGAPRFRDAIRSMAELSRMSSPRALDLAGNSLEAALLWANVLLDDADANLDYRVRQAMDYLTSHLCTPFAMEDLASRCGLSSSRLYHLFREQTGVAPREYLEQQRMAYAAELLRTSYLNVTEVAAQVGFDDPYYFANRFRRHFCKSPTDYRKFTRHEKASVEHQSQMTLPKMGAILTPQ